VVLKRRPVRRRELMPTSGKVQRGAAGGDAWCAVSMRDQPTTLWSLRSAAGITRRWARSTAVTEARSGPSPGMSAAARSSPKRCARRSSPSCGRTPSASTLREGVLRSWLVAQAHARAVHIARSRDASRQDRDARTEHTPPSAEVEIAVHARALTEEGRRAVDQLVPGERDAILLAYFGGHTISETARLLGALEGTVKNHLHSGLLNLRRALEVEGVTT
jgi:Sigma-70, region 4